MGPLHVFVSSSVPVEPHGQSLFPNDCFNLSKDLLITPLNINLDWLDIKGIIHSIKFIIKIYQGFLYAKGEKKKKAKSCERTTIQAFAR